MPNSSSFKQTYPFRLLQRPVAIERIYPRDVSTFFSDPKTHKTTKSYSGRFACTLVAYTPLEVNAQAQAAVSSQRPAFNQNPLIPGASIKGVVRSVAEFAGGGCASILSDRSSDPKALCSDEKVCPTCALFGNMTRGSNAKLLRGRVQISDAKPYQEGDKRFVEKSETLYLYQSSPKAQHSAFYGTPTDISRQKFYHHQKSEQAKISGQSSQPAGKTGYSTLHPVKAGSIFVFQVSFAGLDARLVALLHYALTLESGLLHKMGRGKSFGLGSVKIEIQRAEIEDARARYLGEEVTIQSTSAKGTQALPEDVQKERKERFEKNAALDDFRKMLCFEATKDVSFGFPGHAWFKANSQVPLRPVGDALGWAGGELCQPLTDPPNISPQNAPQEIDTTPAWVKEHDLEGIWESSTDLHVICRRLAAKKYAPNLLSGLQSDIETFRSLDATSAQATLVGMAFRQMFGPDEKGWNTFHRERLLGLPPEVEQTATFSLEDSLAEIHAELAARPDKFFLFLKKERIEANAIPKEHRAAWAKAIIGMLQKEGKWDRNARGVQKQAQDGLRGWEKG